MLRLDSTSNSFAPLERQAELRPRSFFEHYLLNDFLAKSSRAFFAEAGLELLAFASGEFPLAVDSDGRVYVVAAQRGGRRPALALALEQASRIANDSPADLLHRADLADRAELASFLRVPLSQLNRTQGVVLVADSFDEGALRTILWLQGRYGLHVSCIQVQLYADERSGREFVAAKVASLESLQEPPERFLLASAEQPAAGSPAGSPRPSEPEWRRDFAAVFEEAESDEIFAPPPAPVIQETAADALDNLFDEPELVPPEAAEDTQGERRTLPRSPEFHARRLRLDYHGRMLGARLVDFSDKGLGVEVLSPLPIGAEVAVSGEVAGEDGVYSITGVVVVAHCRSRHDGVHRIGFSLEKAKIERLSSPPEDFDRR